MLIVALMIGLAIYFASSLALASFGITQLFRTSSLLAVFKNQTYRKYMFLYRIGITVFETLAFYFLRKERARNGGPEESDSLMYDTIRCAILSLGLNMLGYILWLGVGLSAGTIFQRLPIPKMMAPWVVLLVMGSFYVFIIRVTRETESEISSGHE